MITYLIIGITVLTSIRAFNNGAVLQQLIFNPYIVTREKQWYRFLSSGLIHGSYMHLFVNMYVLYMFGTFLEDSLDILFKDTGKIVYMALYFVGMIFSHSLSFFKHKNDNYYNSLGASGAVSAVVFAGIAINPLQGIGIIFIPVFIPGFIFGLLYLAYSAYMGQQGDSRIGHDAHFMGAIFGFFFLFILKPALFSNFIQQIMGYFS